MNKMQKKIKEIKQDGRIGFMGHVIAGFPSLEISYNAAMGISKGGADFIEIQFPFSDPFADGPTIEDACTTSLANGTKIENCFQLTKKIVKNSNSSILIMTYGNIIFKYGVENFLERASKIGVEGVIIPDIPPENDENLIIECEKYNIAPILLAAPGNNKDRIEYLAKIGKGFIYTVARTGITGNKTEINEDVIEWLDLVRNSSKLPMAVGFGINSSDQIKNLKNYCDITIAGSYFVKEISNGVINNLDIEKYLKQKTEILLCI